MFVSWVLTPITALEDRCPHRQVKLSHEQAIADELECAAVPLDVSYIYPHWVSTLGKDFKIYCLLCSINETQTKAYLIHFTSLNAFWRLHKLPMWFRRFIKNSLFGAAQKLLDGLVIQDVQMIEEE